MSQLAAILARKEEVVQAMAKVDGLIYQLEEEYSSTATNGTLQRGFDLDAKPVLDKKKGRMDPEHRWFTYSSATATVVEMPEEAEIPHNPASRSHKKKLNSQDHPGRDSGRGGGRKKKRRRRDGDDDDDDE